MQEVGRGTASAEGGKITLMEILLVMTNLPDQAAAETLAAALVDNRLAACVNILQPCCSVYRWKGAVEKTDEVPLLIKTSAASYPALEAAILAGHPYELPEIVALPLSHGLPGYLAWVAAETQTENWSSP